MTLRQPHPDRLVLWPQYRQALREANRSHALITSTTLALRNLTDTGTDLADVTGDDVRAYVHRDELAMRTRAIYLSRIRAFYGWCVLEGLLEQDPTMKVRRPQVRKGLPNPISHADLDRALETATPKIRAWLLLGALAGLRIGEAAALHSESIRDGQLVITGKGGKTRAVPILPALAAELAQWPARGFLFPGRVGGHISPKYASNAVALHLHSCGIESSSHKARARFATDFYHATQDVIGTKELLGHSNVETTMAYVQADRSRLAQQMTAMPYTPKERAS